MDNAVLHNSEAKQGIHKELSLVWKCHGCGYCCYQIGKILPGYELDNGWCKHYNQETKQCNIYWERPHQCRVHDMGERFKWFIEGRRFYVNLCICCDIVREG